MKKLFILFLFVTLFLHTAFAANVREDSMGRPLYAADRIKVKLSEDAAERLNLVLSETGDYSNTGLVELDTLLRSINVSKISLAHRPVLDKIWEQENGFNRWYLLFVPIGTDIESTITEISKNDYVEFANPEYISYLSATPNDPYFDDCWGHDNTAQLLSWSYDTYSHTGPPVGTVGFDSHIEEAWDDTQGYGNSSIIIAIIDTGVDYNHEDLDGNCVSGWDYGGGDSDPMDDSADEGHGTCCAGIAAGEVNNSIGVSGVAGNCSIMPLKIANSSGTLLSSAVINAVTHCGDNDVDIASMSFGSNTDYGDDPSRDAALQYAYDNGVTLLACTMNEDYDHIWNPANDPNVIAVGAASPCAERKDAFSCDGENWWGSNYGVNTMDARNAVDVIAPTILPATDVTGVNGYSSGDYYMYFNGTSCATPYAAGVAALIKSKDPSLTPAQIRDILTSTATDIVDEGPAGWDRYTGYGMVNADAAVGAVGTNTWTGAWNHYWHNSSNWSLGHIPTAGEDVIITTAGLSPYVASYDDACYNLTIEAGASLDILDQTLTVNNDATVHGSIDMLNTASRLYIDHDIVWESGSTGSMTGSSRIYVYGDWNFNEGADVQFTTGYVEFVGTSQSWFRSKEENCQLYHLLSNKSATNFSVSSQSTDDLYIAGNLYNNTSYYGSTFQCYSIHSVILDGYFNNLGGNIQCPAGTFVFNGSPTIPLKPNSGDYFNNLTINTGATALSLDASYSTTLQINGDFLLESGYFYPHAFNIEIGGDWTNNAGIGNFGEASSRVVFNGSSGHQYCSNETFNELEVNKASGGAFRINGTNVVCAAYDWTAGAVDVLSGSFTANDLIDNAIQGGYYLNAGGTIDLTNSGTGTFVDLKGDLHIFGGTMTVAGSYCVWPYLEDASIEMSGGILDITSCGISLSSSNTLTEDISGGTIRTPYSFTGNRTDFNPTGGTIELYGSTNASLSMGTGSNFYDVEINKSSKAQSESSKDKEYVIIENRDGTRTRYAKSNTVSAASELDINGYFILDTGVFDTNGNDMYVAGDWANNVGIAGFIEGTNTVIFDGPYSAAILTPETFYDLHLNKTYIGFAGLETGSGDNNGVDVTVTNNLRLYDGTMELNNPTNLAIGNILRIYNGASLNANDPGTINISVVEDWFDYNASGGFDAGSSSVVIFNGTDPGTLQQVEESEYFNDIVINSGAAYVRPSDGIPICCKNMDIVAGKLKISSYKVVVDEDLNISDRLEMSSPDDTLIVNNITWETGSSDIVTDGKIFVSGDWTFNNGTSTQLGTGNTVYFDGSLGSLILCNDSDAEFGTLIIDKTAGPSADTYINGSSSNTMNVSGDMTVSAGNQFHIQDRDLVVQNTLDIVNTGEMDMVSGGTLTNNSDFTLNGLLDVADGDVLLHGLFELAATGTLTIDGGNFVCDAPCSKGFVRLYGTMNLSSGIFEVTHNQIAIQNTFTENITGGTIRAGGTFFANTPNTFQPENNTFESINSIGGTYLTIDTTNYFNDFTVNNTVPWGIYSPLRITGNVLISAGTIYLSDPSNGNLYVGGDWTNNVGPGGFVEWTRTVTFYGPNPGDITTDETFYDLTIDKTATGYEDVEIMDGMTVNVTNDLNITDGNIEMNTGSTLNIGNDMDIALNAGLNAGGVDTGLNLTIGGDWTNSNTTYDSWVGFWPGLSTVTFNGSSDQFLSTACTQEDFYDLVINKSAGEFKSNDDTQAYGNIIIYMGIWKDNITALTHTVWGDFTVGNGGAMHTVSMYNTIIFKGTSDATLEYLGVTGYFHNIIVDKTSTKYEVVLDPDAEKVSPSNNTDGGKAQYVTVLSYFTCQQNGSLIVEDGTLDLNGNSFGGTGDVIINNGGILIVNENAALKIGSSNTLTVNNGGILQAIGSSSNKAVIQTLNTGYYDFNVESGGTISAEYATFEDMSANGVYVKDGAIIDASHPFNNCIFKDGIAAGTLLRIDNDQTFIADNVNFPTNTWSGASNVFKNMNQGHVTFAGSTGGFAGPMYEDDTFNRIHWTGFGPDLTITDTVWSDMNPYVCDMIDVAVTVKNIGNVDVTNWFYVDLYYDLPSPPSIFQSGDQNVYIDSGLPAGDSLIVNFNGITSTTGTIWSSYFQVDADSNIVELNKNNNVWGPDAITWNALPAINDLTIHYNAGNIELNWSYSAGADSFYIYRDTDPYFIPVYGTPYVSIDGASTSWNEPATGTTYFYIVTAVKSSPSPLPEILNNKEFKRIINR